MHYTLEKPFTISIESTLLKPKSVFKKRQYPAVKPDLDNLEKAVLDAMNRLIYTDDALICHKYCVEWYTTNASETRVSIDIKTMKEIA
ncbi:MAG TPA: RusA family crossover junction endodeoxyribonuclease [Bacillota bacterium]|nr:RusA family crossover junction endodeoxyribonuclease [Bacillota bacterium]HOH09629.1 RusA family crossover junction endodeoxyribonuclease [Bacillota bacterium]HOY88870.1 RusA family crossover junction endodeoxyribonuclease [Bacillota bacterium]HPI00516.1 RusA family crossover junction endodeoxyribonuclease [Bacillota bacterium]HPM62938.1 RusA family crossover junction endodeoxyribonuclease [Bacillota bacterium]